MDNFTNMEIPTAESKEREARSRAVLVCPDNDAEARMILMLAEKAGIETIRSEQPHGARLAAEEDIFKKVHASGKPDVWIVEIPGPAEEEAFRKADLNVRIIDHHTYQGIDRLTNPETGKQNSSSLEQFMASAGITDKELRAWGFDPKIVKGVGIMDALYAQGLRKVGYTQDEIRGVLDYIKKLSEAVDPNLGAVAAFAEKDWEKRTERNGYIVVVSEAPQDTRGAISSISIREGVDEQPMIVSSQDGSKITVQNVGPDVIEKLKKNINGNTYTFGTNRCWGVNNAGQKKKVTLEEVFQALGI